MTWFCYFFLMMLTLFAETEHDIFTHWIKLFGAQVLVAILVQERVHHLMIGRMTIPLENTILVE